MRRTKEDTAMTRQSVLDAALVVFSEKGYAATRLDDIAERAGMTRGAIYWHFTNKADLYMTLVREVTSRIEPVMENSIAEGGSYPAMIRRMLLRSLGYLEDNEQYRLVLELTMFNTDRLPELEEGMTMKTQATEAVITYLTAIMQAGIDAGELRADLKARDSAIALLGLQNGLATTWLLCEQSFSLRDSAHAAAEIFVRGLER